MVLVPPYVEVDGLVVRLVESSAEWRDVTPIVQHSGDPGSVDQLLSFVANNLLSEPSHRVLELIRSHARLPLSPGIDAEPIERGKWPAAEYAEGLSEWTKATGRPVQLDDAYSLGATFLRQSLVIPRTTLLALMERLYELNEAVRTGRMEAKIDRSIPIPLPRLDLPEPSWDDEELGALERALAELDVVDPLVAALAEPRSETTRRGLERRAYLFRSLEFAEAWARRGQDDVYGRAKALGHAVICQYLDAVAELRAYLGSDDRLEVLATFAGGHASAPAAVAAEVERPMLAAASIDLFRLPRPSHPSDLRYYQWLAMCEGCFRYDSLVAEVLPAAPADGAPRAGDLFTRVRRVMTRLRFRSEHGTGLHLWRAERD